MLGVSSKNPEDYLSFKEKIDSKVNKIDELMNDNADHSKEIREIRDRIWDMLCEATNDEDRQYANKYLYYGSSR